MTSDPRAFFTLDHGAATTSAALVARLAGRWRLLAATSFPATVPVEPVLGLLVDRVAAADPGLAAAVGADRSALDRFARVSARTAPPRRIAVVAASERSVAPLAAAALTTGWRVAATSAERADALAMTALLLDGTVDAVLAGAGEPAGADERPALDQLADLVAAVAERRPELTVVLAGSMAERVARFERSPNRPGEVLLAPAPDAGEPPGLPLRRLLDELRAPIDDGRRAMARAAGSLARVLDRRLELVEVGFSGGLRVRAEPGGADDADVTAAIVDAAGLAGSAADDASIDGIAAWSTVALDRYRLRDRLHELRTAPWGDAAGDGAQLRLAAGRAALGRLLGATPELSGRPSPDLVVAAGGVWAVAPGPAVALALSDVVRRPGASHVTYDHARLLGPLGTIDDGEERRRIVRDLADELLVPLATVVMPQGMRAGRSAGTLLVHGASGTTELDLVPGGLELVDLPPGETAIAEFRFRDAVRLGTRGRHFAVDVAGGLGGLLVDLRDVPLRLPERQDRRRNLLRAWQSALWTGLDG